MAGGLSRLAREAIVFVNLAGKPGTVKLRYLVSAATWLPSYNARSADDKRIKLDTSPSCSR